MKGDRTCVACRRIRNRGEMLRIAKTPDGCVPDEAGILPGRGAYVCDTPECLEAAAKTRAFNRSFREAVSPELYRALRERAARER